jgi:uncharacterized membrane protein YgaE (UPF0421/DUF939 family)
LAAPTLNRHPDWLPSIQLTIRASVAAILALVRWLEFDFPIYAFIAAVITTDLDPATSRKLGLRRVFATVVGALCGAISSLVLPPGIISVGIGFFVAMLLAQVLGAGEGARVAGYICGIVLLDHSAEPWYYALHRFAETAIGVAVAWLISWIPKLVGPNGSSSVKPED